MKLTFLRSRVARRVFTQFILAAFIPVAATTFLVVDQTKTNLTEQSYKQLSATGKSIGQSIYERLSFVERAIEDVTEGLKKKRTTPERIEPVTTRYFQNLTIVPDSTYLAIDFDGVSKRPNPQSVARHLADGGSLLAWAESIGKHPQLSMSRLLDTTRPDSGIIVADVKLDYLWGDPESRQFVMEFCVLQARRIIIFCSAPWAESIAAQIPAKSTTLAQGDFIGKFNDEKFLASYWQIFLSPQYLAPNWTVLAIRAETDILAPIAAFNKVFAPVILLSVLLVAFLSIMQIRKILVPLDKLISGTRRISARQFKSEICVTSGDEFQELATSMNTMSHNLETQFETLRTLSEIDRLILSHTDIETVIETILTHLGRASNYDVGSLTLIDHDSITEARMFIDNVGSELSIERIILPEKQHRLFSTGTTQLFDAREADSDFLRPLRKLGAESIFVLPIMSNKRLSAIISLGYRATFVPAEDVVTQIKSFGDRITVALATAEHEEKLYRQAHYDPLTALPNRQLFKDRLQQSIARAHRESKKGALLYIDLDRFKIVNDSQGHTAGDALLGQVAVRLQRYISDADTVARLGGDEFAVVLSNVTSPQMVSQVADELQGLLSKPFEINNRDQFISVSIGIAIYPDDGTTIEDLLKNADTAMYRAKASGRGQHAFFTGKMNIQAINRHQLESDLHGALDKDQFYLEYQPQVDIHSHKIVAVEALLRWQHMERGLVSPAEFIPIAEDSGHIVAIGEWVLLTACQQFVLWKSQGIALERIAVNVSPVQIAQSDFVATVGKVLAETKMAAYDLELEITESLLLGDTDKALQTLKILHAMGIRIAIDDFGTGYSSLSYLSRFSFDILKIDKSFVADIGTSDEAVAIVQAITALAQSLGIEVVAEGIETREQSAFLGRAYCQIGQGYLFSKPISAQELVHLVTGWDRQKAS